MIVYDNFYYNYPDDYAGAGAEYLLRYPAVSIAARFGYNSRALGESDGLTGFSTGLGFLWRELALDYAFVPFGSLGSAQRISLSIKFVGKT